MTRATGFACTVHCFEPQSDLFGRMCDNARHIPAASFVPVNKGLYSESTTLHFREDGYANGSARVAEDGEVAIEVISVDDYARESGVERVDMISLDVEGSELEVLRGARESIERFAPKLQLSLYHQLSHLWEVYETVKAMCGDYRFHVGHHTQHFNETMLYAIRAE
ncbi:MAG: hypothetical protein AUJ49_06260 [Desulfovibrionaceae bacterium CG1_02_65_16]|nr:MAG: hypothetical protein AUJ49_06260 [Desulfovibrionaceae bacterium CG1_02_65_16]